MNILFNNRINNTINNRVNNKIFLFSFIVAFILSLSSSVAFAQQNTTNTSTAKSPMTDAQIQQLFDLAMQQRDKGKVFAAIQTFEYLLTRRPSLNRARLELAVSYDRASRYEAAQKQLKTVLDDPKTPEKVRLAILAYLGQVNSDKSKPTSQHHLSYYAKAGVLYNTNINFAPLRGSPEYQIPDGQDTSSPGLDTFFSISDRYSRKKPLNIASLATQFQWQSQASWTGNNYTRTSKYNLNIFSLSTGPAFIATGHWHGAINVQLDQAYFGTRTLGTFISINPLISFDLGNYRSITVEASYTDNNFSQSADNGRDGNTALAGAAWTSLFNGTKNGLEAGFRLINQNADDDQYGFNSNEIYLGGFIAAGSGANIYMNVHTQKYNYDAPPVLNNSNIILPSRDERENRFVVGYNRDIANGPLKDWTVNAHASYTRNNSNVDAFSYDRTIAGINLTRYFQ